MPSIFLYLMFATLTILPWYTGIILAMAEFFGMHHVGFLLPTRMTTLKIPLIDCYPRSIEQADIYRERHCEPLLLRYYIWLDGLGWIRLGNTTTTT